MKLNPDHEWTKLPRWKKRIEGFMCYLVCLFFCLIHPEATDYALYQHIKGQFIEDEED